MKRMEEVYMKMHPELLQADRVMRTQQKGAPEDAPDFEVIM